MGNLRKTLALLDKECESLQESLINPAITDKDMLARAIGGNEADWLTTIQNVGRLLLWWDIDKKHIKRQIADLKDTLEKMEERETWIREYTVESMINRGENKPLKFPDVTVYWQFNQPSVEVLDEKAIPMQFQRLIPARYEVDKSQILDYVKKSGEIPSGVKIITDRKHLVVR